MKRFSLGGIALLKDLFSSVSNRVNGFEHTLARRSKEFRMRPGNKIFPHKSGCGPQECARRVRQMQRAQAKAAQIAAALARKESRHAA